MEAKNLHGVEPDRASVRTRLDRVFGGQCSIPGYAGDTRGTVENTAEFRRVHDLPRSDWRKRTDLGELVDILTAEYRTPTGSMVLRPIQAATLEALFDNGGAFGAIGVGEGKTLITYLAPLVMGAQRPLLIVPAKLREKTLRDFAALSKDWRKGAEVEVISYEWLSRVRAADFLEDFDPDLISCDEVHRIKNPGASCTRRIVRHLRERPDVALLALSGTVASRSLLDFHHLLALTVGPEKMPLPAPVRETKQWARAVDEKVSTRARPGPLTLLLDKGEAPSLESVRAAVGRRLFESRGVLNTDRASVAASIVVDFDDEPIPPECRDLMRTLIRDKEAPNGDPCTPADVWRHARTLTHGFFYEWDPAPPEEWLDARRDWKRFARDILDQDDPEFDSELQVARACQRGALDSWGAWETWSQVRDEFRPNSVARWVADPWVPNLMGPTIIWVDHVALGERLSTLLGFPYFHRLGRTSSGDFIDDHDPDLSMIASIQSNAEGRNLQGWSRNLIMSPPASGRTWEQMLGRTHRAGQTADEVEVTIRLGHHTARDQVRQALADARFISATTGQPQRLLAADFAAEL